ncbi:hypothetical protein B0T17DRAFT_517414 [Bombardia bombarda]|uniref:J domain-containing protein n=1 Tax=Bombardia bombarda TaxID=252184 RepID=A0AA39XL01_9PEZI|nr:hypothetical protein B0T17DRAFT_517414 [Bombardia bombarda]
MPLRFSTPIGAALRLQQQSHRQLAHCHSRNFHISRILRAQDDDSAAAPADSDSDPDKNHYDTLKVHQDASAVDIKKSFYRLSKTHHPDVNPSDPHAPRRFMRISEAYHILSHPDKRARYDRDVLRLQRARPHTHLHPSGSYHSSNPAGGRPASGLSRRRGTFTGPPPSFYRSGGWGTHSAKRRAAQHDSSGSGTSEESTAGGMGHGQDPYRGTASERPWKGWHWWDAAGHTRTQERVEEMRAKRAAERAARDPTRVFNLDTGMWGGFMLITSVLGIAFLAPYVAGGGWKKQQEGKQPSGRKVVGKEVK